MISTKQVGAAVILLLLVLPVVAAGQALEIGDTVGDVVARDSAGNTVSLAEYAGKIVVLEWLNPDCPFVKRHYKAGTMKRLAERYKDKGVVWLAVNSTHYMDAKASEKFRAQHQLPYPILVDQEGTLGDRFGAKTTPHLFVISRKGKLVYAGAIDDDPRGDRPGNATNYVAQALDELLAGQQVSTAQTRSYGCSVKYK